MMIGCERLFFCKKKVYKGRDTYLMSMVGRYILLWYVSTVISSYLILLPFVAISI